ncbi:MAG: hypothetical protein Q7T33_07235 [Dehalococcoidia bacterium]|nr:hypothetical protein [Dehalococcoidia bacterium]
MPRQTAGPTLVQDLGALAGLYRTVFWLIGQRLQHGKEWQRHVKGDGPWLMMMPDAPEPSKERAA